MKTQRNKAEGKYFTAKEHKRDNSRLWKSFIDKLLTEFIYDFSVDETHKESESEQSNSLRKHTNGEVLLKLDFWSNSVKLFQAGILTTELITGIAT